MPINQNQPTASRSSERTKWKTSPNVDSRAIATERKKTEDRRRRDVERDALERARATPSVGRRPLSQRLVQKISLGFDLFVYFF